MKKNLIQFINAVTAGFVLVVVLSIGTDFMLEKTGLFPTYLQLLKTGWMVLFLYLSQRVWCCFWLENREVNQGSYMLHSKPRLVFRGFVNFCFTLRLSGRKAQNHSNTN